MCSAEKNFNGIELGLGDGYYILFHLLPEPGSLSLDCVSPSF